MKHLKSMLLGICITGLTLGMSSKIDVQAAGTVSYQKLDGTAITTGTTEDSNFDDVVAATGETPLAYLYDTCRSAAAPSSITTTTCTVVTASELGDGHYGYIAGASDVLWFVYDEPDGREVLYLVSKTGGKVTIEDNTTKGSGSITQEYTGTFTEMYRPSFFYSDNEGNGIKDAAVYDEMSYSGDEWYTFTDAVEKKVDVPLSSRDSIIVPGLRMDQPASGTMAPASVGWSDFFSTITDIYVSDDIKLKGNINSFFNANSTAPIQASSIAESKYKALKNIYLYCDMSEVTSAAGTFARIGTLENIFVRGNETKSLGALESASFMFYGDSNLKNDSEDSFIQNMDLSKATGLTSTWYMFAGCEGLYRPNVGTYYMNNVTNAEGMFFGAKNAQLVSEGSDSGYDVSQWNLESLLNASLMFSGGDADGSFDATSPKASMDAGIEELSDYGNVVVGDFDMSSWDMRACLTTYMMFSRNGELFIGVTLGDSYDALLDASGMFLRDDYLRRVSMCSAMPVLKNATMMFKLAGSKATQSLLPTIDMKGFLAPKLVNADFMFYGTGYTLIDTNDVTAFSSLESAIAMFAGNKNLISFGEGALKKADMSSLVNPAYMFMDDEQLSKVDTSAWDMSKVSTLEYMFQNTPALNNGLDVSTWKIGNNLKNAECFCYNNGASKYDLSNWNTSGVTNFAFSFANNKNLENVITSGTNNMLYAAETLCGMFSDNPKLKSVGGLVSQNGTSKLKDVRGVFANDRALTSVNIKQLVGKSTKWVSYLLKNCEKLSTCDVSGWNTVSVEYVQGMFDGCDALKSISLGTGFTAVKVVDSGAMMRDCHNLSQASINSVLASFETASGLLNIYEMVKDCYQLVTLDMSGMNLTNTIEYRRVACMDEDDSYTTNKLVTIKLPETYLSADGVVLKDSDGSSINMFWVDGDGVADGKKEEDSSADDLLTTLYIDGTPGENVINYPFGGTNGNNDNRSFVKLEGRTINGNDVGTYELDSKVDKADLAMNAKSYFYTEGTTATKATASPLSYSWIKDGSGITGADKKTYEATKSGSYVSNAMPSILKGSNSSVSASYTLASALVGIDAKYTGKEVTVGTNYSLDDVSVVLKDSDGKEYPLTSDDYTVDSQKVTKTGDNTFEVTYKTGSDVYKTKLIVPGVRLIGSISATYAGPSVVVGKEYDSDYVTVMAFYADDTSKSNGFEVTPSALSSLKVTAAGDNTFTATYKDKTQDKTFSAEYKVNGYKPVTSITAIYTGDKVKVGNKYNKDDVKVTLYYSDGSGSSSTTNFSVDSDTVTAEGGNSFTATYRDPFGNTYSGGFSVPGYMDGNTTAPVNTNNNTDNSAGVVTSTVSAPSQTYSASSVRSGKAAGIVQTGRTGKTVLYVVTLVALACLIAMSMYLKGRKK